MKDSTEYREASGDNLILIRQQNPAGSSLYKEKRTSENLFIVACQIFLPGSIGIDPKK